MCLDQDRDPSLNFKKRPCRDYTDLSDEQADTELPDGLNIGILWIGFRHIETDDASESVL